MSIRVDSPRTPDVLALLEEHLAEMHATSPAESVHALGVQALEHPSITLWSARAAEDGTLLGVGALKTHPDATGELKSMRTTAEARGRGVAAAILHAIVERARRDGLTELNLETGAEPHFASARRLYERHGFTRRGPFAEYVDDPNSVYYGRAIDGDR